ncbi:maleylpyruvate isomerase family mycothiol-dependent enzyme [Nocardioides limicola]|uniref:maleylpyruvate isomerase family mycothiol-dependent enzyme n=1 Tax=Nocardioides limicola TaxID=2803368 RepID=UPI00193C5D15|nr:maleylpyruvate isomerase family mycothiol-dependent enzyme [Nocardioides sp. DJM-14]
MHRESVIRDEATRFAEVLAGTDPQARCPSCPDWSADDLLWHLTEVHLFWGGILRSGALTDAEVAAVDEAKPTRPTDTASLLRLRERATADLLAELERLGDDEPRWTWWPAEQTVGFTRRMQTYEATFHRIDAELTAGLTPDPISPDVAAGAVDHCVDVMWGWLPGWASYDVATTARFVATDTGADWLVEVGRWSGTQPTSGTWYDVPRALRASEGTPRVTATGTVEDLARWAWGRGDQVDLTGEPEAVAAVAALIAEGID